MFTKTTLAKVTLAPLAAATVLSTLVSVSATPAPTLQARDGGYAPTSWTTTSSSYWPQKTGDHNGGDCGCGSGWGKDHVPKVTQPNKDAVWKVGSQQKVTTRTQGGEVGRQEGRWE